MRLEAILKAVWFTPGPNGRWGLPLLLEGPPGTGKTGRIASTGERFGLPVEAIISSLREPADFLGVPVPQDDGTISYVPGAFATRLDKAGRGVLFLDELNTAAPATQAALLRVTQEGVVGDLALPKGVRIVAAQNAVQEAAGGWDLAPPLANRFGHLPVPEIGAEEWGRWLLGSGDSEREPGDAAREEARVEAAFPAPWAKAKGLVSAFIKSRPEVLHKMPAAGTPEASKAWPSPRTWELATRAIAGAEVHGLDDVEADALLAAFVGTGPAAELAQWIREQDLPDPARLLDGEVEFKHDPKRLDRTFAVLSSCAALISPEGAAKRNDRVTALWKLFKPLAKSAPDLCVSAIKVLVERNLTFGKFSSVSTPVLNEMHGILADAGILNPGR